MSKFEVVMALLSFVYALALTHLLQGISNLIQNRGRVLWSAVHGAWLFLALITLINNWLSLIPLREADWGVPLVLLAFTASAIQYFTCSLIIPSIPAEGTIDLRKFQLEEAKVFIAPYIFMLGPIIGQNAVFRREFGYPDLSLTEFLLRNWPLYLGVAFLGLAMWRKERLFRLVVPLFFGFWTVIRMMR